MADLSAPPQRLGRGINFLIALIGCLGAAWGLTNLQTSAASGDFFDSEAQLLQFHTFNPSTAGKALASDAAHNASACNRHAQRALLLLEIPLTNSALQAGQVGEFDQHFNALEQRLQRYLSCAPRDSLGWLVAFALRVERGALDQSAFNLLETSYLTSRNEAWLSLRRIAVAAPLLLSTPRPTQGEILDEYQSLLRNRFFEGPARVYQNAPPGLQALLKSRIARLDGTSQRGFADAVQALQRH